MINTFATMPRGGAVLRVHVNGSWFDAKVGENRNSFTQGVDSPKRSKL